MYRTPSVVLVGSALALGLATLWLTFELPQIDASAPGRAEKGEEP